MLSDSKNLLYENDDFIPKTGTAFDGSTLTTTKVGFIKDKITEALMGTFTERMQVFNPTSGAGLILNEDVTAAPVVTTDEGAVLEAVTVTEAVDTATMVSGLSPSVRAELPTDNADNDTAE